MAELASVEVTISGRVTGIGFRAFVRGQAAVLGLNGYVRNLPGLKSVEVKAEGDRANLEKLVGYLKKGPPLARIQQIAITWSEYTGKYRDFSVLPS